MKTKVVNSALKAKMQQHFVLKYTVNEGMGKVCGDKGNIIRKYFPNISLTAASLCVFCFHLKLALKIN